MKKSKSSASNVVNRPKVDRADTYPGRASGVQLSSAAAKNASTTANASYNRKLTNPRNGGGGAAGGNGVIKWLKHITDAADSYKNKDAAKSKKTAAPPALDSPTGQLNTIDEMLVMDRTAAKNAESENSQRQEYDDANDGRISSSSSAYSQQQQQRQQQQHQELRKLNSYQKPVGRVEVMRFEEPELVQPDEVTISLTQVIDKQDVTANPVEFIKEKNRTIEIALAEKKNLLAKILQIPVENYDYISEVVDEIRNSIDVNELILSSMTQADKLTMLISKHLDSNLLLAHEEKLDDTFSRVNDNDEDDDAYSTPTGSPRSQPRSNAPLLLTPPTPPSLTAREIPVAVSSSQLMAISLRLRRNLTQLMGVMTNREREEKERSKSKRSQSNGQIGVMTSSRGQEVGVDVSRDVSVSFSPEIIEPLINRRGECVASLSVVDPIFTERLEVIEPETFVMGCSKSAAANSDGGATTKTDTTTATTQRGIRRPNDDG